MRESWAAATLGRVERALTPSRATHANLHLPIFVSTVCLIIIIWLFFTTPPVRVSRGEYISCSLRQVSTLTTVNLDVCEYHYLTQIR